MNTGRDYSCMNLPAYWSRSASELPALDGSQDIVGVPEAAAPVVPIVVLSSTSYSRVESEGNAGLMEGTTARKKSPYRLDQRIDNAKTGRE